ncbi:MAG: hypothetical protein ACE5EG_03480 [Thermoanaerobaculia bacterium]
MTLRPPAPRPLLPIPLSVLLTLLWVGLVRLLFLLAAAQAGAERDGGLWMAVLFETRVLGRARLPTIIVAISLLLLLYLWVEYRSRPPQTWRTVVFLFAAALLVYLGWAVWHSWWSRLDAFGRPDDMLMTLLAAAGAAFGSG